MILLGYNTPVHNPPAPEHDHLADFHTRLVMQAGAYQNGTWVVAVAKAGREEGCDLIGQSQIIAPSGETIAMTSSLGDELITARCDLALCASFKTTVFDFARHRRPEHYRLIVDRAGAIPPPEALTPAVVSTNPRPSTTRNSPKLARVRGQGMR